MNYYSESNGLNGQPMNHDHLPNMSNSTLNNTMGGVSGNVANQNYHPYNAAASNTAPSNTQYAPYATAVQQTPPSYQQPPPPQQNPPPAGDYTPKYVPCFERINPKVPLPPRNSIPPGEFAVRVEQNRIINPLAALTYYLIQIYHHIDADFRYEPAQNPRRVLTHPSKGKQNDGYDNDQGDYILYVSDILQPAHYDPTRHFQYQVLDILGQGTFGQVVKCQNLTTGEIVAVKVIKNRRAYFNQSMMEVSVLDILQDKKKRAIDGDNNPAEHVLTLKDTFIHKKHLCLVFELLSVNLYELIKQNQFRGLSTTLVRAFTKQLLQGIELLKTCNLIHCDLKPENILLVNLEQPQIKIIDFGSACDERNTIYSYIQSRFYRAPEVILALKYNSAIDMWSLGCIVVELLLGLPIFPGTSEFNQISRITKMLGPPPDHMLRESKKTDDFFIKTIGPDGRSRYRIRTLQEFIATGKAGPKEEESKPYFKQETLEEIVMAYPMPRVNMQPADIDKELKNRRVLLDFVRGLLTIDPQQRWQVDQALSHPFVNPHARFQGGPKYGQPPVAPAGPSGVAMPMNPGVPGLVPQPKPFTIPKAVRQEPNYRPIPKNLQEAALNLNANEFVRSNLSARPQKMPAAGGQPPQAIQVLENRTRFP